MDLEKIVRAAPIGLLMLVGSYVASRRRKSGQARAAQEFPETAKRLGLEFRAPSQPGRIGVLHGRFRSYEVFVDPDERPRIVVYFSRQPAVVLRTYEHEKRIQAGMVRLDTGSTFLNGLFKDRYASAELVEALVGNSSARVLDLETRVRKITEALGKNLAHLSVTPERVECGLEFGRPAHIPGERVAMLVPEVVELVRFLEEVAADSSVPSATDRADPGETT